DGSCVADLLRFQGRISEGFGIKCLRSPNRGGLVLQVGADAEQGVGHGAVDHPGIEVAKSIMGGKTPGERALARGGGAIDGDDHEGLVSCWQWTTGATQWPLLGKDVARRKFRGA